MDLALRLIALYVLNGVCFLVQDFRTRELSRRPDYVRDPSLSRLLLALLVTPVAPFLVVLEDIAAGRLGIRGCVVLGTRLLVTVGAYSYCTSNFSLGPVIGFGLALPYLRKTLRDLESGQDEGHEGAPRRRARTDAEAPSIEQSLRALEQAEESLAEMEALSPLLREVSRRIEAEGVDLTTVEAAASEADKPIEQALAERGVRLSPDTLALLKSTIEGERVAQKSQDESTDY